MASKVVVEQWSTSTLLLPAQTESLGGVPFAGGASKKSQSASEVPVRQRLTSLILDLFQRLPFKREVGIL
jgi:hypothetical protein